MHRSDHQRCPKCKKLRLWWCRANHWHQGRERPAYVGGVKVCWLCVKRAKEQGLEVFSTKEDWENKVAP